ncbi:MAG: 2-hydroxycyclohexanecarboxyl-CoA dehydrogenase [Phenylobacterium zucineum]|nr:MAG: 2-hydroxycyclohexanecarboxyl-CoA dehydrogenase [Phenylobacterium zucineum]
MPTERQTLEGRVALVTGGAKGIGAAIVETLAARGAKVVILDRDAVAAPSGVRAFQVDVGDYQAVDQAVQATVAELGRLDIVVNNAGWDRVQPFIENTPDLWDTLVRINLIGVLNVTHAALRAFAGQPARIINVASDAGRTGSSGEAAYSACKGGVIAFSKAIAREGARTGVLVNCVCPGPTATPLLDEIRTDATADRIMDAVVRATPLRKLAQPSDVAAAVAYFAEEPGHVTGQVISVSGGLTMAG